MDLTRLHTLVMRHLERSAPHLPAFDAGEY